MGKRRSAMESHRRAVEITPDHGTAGMGWRCCRPGGANGSARRPSPTGC
jgi:hypothetical protein